MEIREIEIKDIFSVAPIYISYYNNQEDNCWTEITAEKRIHQVLIATEYQNIGYGSMLLKELELRVHKKGSACIELQAVADEHHERYYGKVGYHNAKNFVMKVKWFE